MSRNAEAIARAGRVARVRGHQSTAEGITRKDTMKNEKVKTNVGSGKYAGTYRHYRRQADGSLKLVGTVAYRHDAEPSPDFDTVLRENLGYTVGKTRREAENARNRDLRDAAAFEALVDGASESEG